MEPTTKKEDSLLAASPERPIPSTAEWKPRCAPEKLGVVFGAECKAAEERLLKAMEHEKNLAIDSFDSGLPFEAAVRRELEGLLPRRYSIRSGLVLDRDGKTAGNCDVVVFNDLWFSPVKNPATREGGRTYMPIEGVYAVGEVKQTLSLRELDLAAEKLVKCHRLNRPHTYAHRLVENREGVSCPHGLTNPLFTFTLAGTLAPNETFENLADRFFYISKQLKRLEVVRALCVLGVGTLVWGFCDPLHREEIRPALFVEDDLFHPIFPVILTNQSAFFSLVQVLQLSLFHVILGPEDLATAYGYNSKDIKCPADSAIALPPDPEWLKRLAQSCRER